MKITKVFEKEIFQSFTLEIKIESATEAAQLYNIFAHPAICDASQYIDTEALRNAVSPYKEIYLQENFARMLKKYPDGASK